MLIQKICDEGKTNTDVENGDRDLFQVNPMIYTLL
ncbi:MAG: hypothetical protein ACI8SK_000731 [Shewanella sp.]|jgi:hypothetical protein